MSAAVKNRAALMFVTAGNEEQAASIGHVLVAERLAACANIVGPIRSIYRWRAQVHDEHEQLILIKTRVSLVAKVERRVKELHSYEVPEVIAIPIAQGSRQYLAWVFDSTAPAPVRGKREARR